ncbi:MAG TPA: methionyl-tRNA formyltransferase [Acidimicrobiia bacterium]
MTRVAFLGTPTAALPTLNALIPANDVALVVTQPDRPRGRSKQPVPSPVKAAGVELGLRVEQPTTAAGLFDALSSVPGLDVAVVVAYGRIIRPESLLIPGMGMLNVHFSLLPRWRGAAPVNRALIAGDSMTGVTIIKLDVGLDTGPVLTAQAVDIEAGENAGSLTDRLAIVGARLLAGSLPSYLSGDLAPQPQSDEGLTYASKIEKGDRVIDIRHTPMEIVNLIRGLAPDPAAVLTIDGQLHKILQASVVEEVIDEGTWETRSGLPVVGLSDGSFRIDSIQPPGRSVMPSADWLRGLAVQSGQVE